MKFTPTNYNKLPHFLKQKLLTMPKDNMQWKKATETPKDNKTKFIRYCDFKDIAYFENGLWVNANNDEPLQMAIVNNLEWLHED